MQLKALYFDVFHKAKTKQKNRGLKKNISWIFKILKNIILLIFENSVTH